MPVLQPKKIQNNSADFDKSVAVFDFPDSDEPSPSQVLGATAPRRNLSCTKRRRIEPTNTNTTKVEKENKLVTSPHELKSGTNCNITVCPMCRHQFPDNTDDETRTLHLSECSGLATVTKSKMVDRAINIPSCSKIAESGLKATSTKMVGRGNDSPSCSKNVESDVCPICNKLFTCDQTASEKEIHINKCLDSDHIPSESNEESRTIEEDEILARSLQHEEEQGPSSVGVTVCQICFKDFAKFSVGQQTRHINSCMDKMEMFEGKKTKRTNPRRRAKTTQPTKRPTKIPRKTCPICKAEHPENKFNAHFKKCAGKRKLTAHQLTKIIQEHKLEIQLDAEKIERKRDKEVVSSTLIKPSQIDVMNGTIIEEQRRLIENRFEEEEAIPSTPALPKCTIGSNKNRSVKYPSGCDGNNTQEKVKVIANKLWDLSAYSLETLNSMFLLTDLHPGIVDSDTQIPSVEKETKEDKYHPSSLIDNSSINAVKLVFSPSTSSDNKCFSSTDSINTPIEIDVSLNVGTTTAESDDKELSKDGFIRDEIDEEVETLKEQSMNDVILNYDSMVGSTECSDFKFLCGDKQEVFCAHKILLISRSNYFKQAISGEQLEQMSLKKFSLTAVKLCVRFIYTGQLIDEIGDGKELEKLLKLSDRFELSTLSRYCTLLKSKSEKNDQYGDPDKGDDHHDDNNGIDLNDIVSSFWQDNDLENEAAVDSDEMDTSCKNDKEDFSDDEIDELREIFQSQAINKNKCEPVNSSLVSDELDDAPDEYFFVPDINKTIERSMCSDPEDLPGEINRGLLGESPSKANLSNSLSSIKSNVGEKAETSSLDIVKSLSSSTVKSSLEVLASDSPKPDLEEVVDIVVRSGSYASGSSYGSAATEPYSETDCQPAITINPDVFTPKGRKLNGDDGLEEFISERNNDSVDLKDASTTQYSRSGIYSVSLENLSTKNSSTRRFEKKKKSSGPISVITVPSEQEQVFVLDESNQAKANCQELTVVGSMFFTNDEDYHTFVGNKSSIDKNHAGDETIERTDALLQNPSLLVAEELTIVINRDTTTTTSSETDVEEKRRNSRSVNDSSSVLANGSMNLFHDDSTNKTMTDITPPVPFSCDTPLPLSIETPFIIPNTLMRKDGGSNFLSDNSLEDVEIPGLSPDNFETTNNNDTLCGSKSIEIDPTSSNAVIHKGQSDDNNSQAADFEISESRIGGTLLTNAINIGDDTQSQPQGDSISQSLILADTIDTSTPHTGSGGSTKRHFLKLRHRLHAESPISRRSEKTILAQDNDVYVVADSPKAIDLENDITAASSKRKKAISSSEEEVVSTDCESTNLSNLSQKKRSRKRAKTNLATATKASWKNSSLMAKRLTVEETSQSSDDNDCVSESDSRSYYINKKRSKKSPFHTSSPSTSTTSSKSLKRRSVEFTTPNINAWLSAVPSPNAITIKTSTTTAGAMRKKNGSSATSKGKEAKKKKKSPRLAKNADFKRMLAQHIDGGGDDEDDIGDGSDECQLEENPSTQSNYIGDNSVNEIVDDNVTVVDESTCSDDGDNTIQNCEIMVHKINENSLEILQNHDTQKSISTECESSNKTTSGILILSPKGEAKDTNRTLKEGGNVNSEDLLNISNEINLDGDNNSTSNAGNDNDYCGDNYSYDNDMYFMEDGGYNSFVLELPCTETSGEKGSSYNCREKSIDVANEAPKESKNRETSKNSIYENEQSSSLLKANFCSVSDLHHDSFNVSDLERVDVDSVATKTPQGKQPKGQAGGFKTPNSLTTSLNQSEFTDKFETPQSSKMVVKDKDACKNFLPGCSKHPETKEAITPMPDFGQLPTPDLKNQIKKFAIRDIPKNKMVAKLVEVYKYQHGFSHWEEEPPKPTRKRKAKATTNEAKVKSAVLNEDDSQKNPTKSSAAATTTTKSYAPVCQVLDENNEEVPPVEHKKKDSKNKKEKKAVVTEDELFLYIQMNSKLYEKILSYQPIEVNELIEVVEAATSATINKSMLERFLDQQCICLKKEAVVESSSQSEQPKRPTRGRGGRGRAKTKVRITQA